MTHSAGVPFATGPEARPEADERQRVRPRDARQPANHLPAGHGARLPRADVGTADPRDRLGRHRQGHPRHPRRRDPQPARLPLDQLRRCAARCSAGRAQPCHRQAAARTDRGGLQAGDRRHDAPDHPVHQHAAVPHQRGAVVQHRLDRQRAVPLRRDAAPRRRTRRRAGDAAGDAARRDDAGPTPAPRHRDRPDADALGHRIHVGVQAVRPVRAQRPRRVRPHRPGRHRGLGRSRARALRSAWSAAASRAATARPSAIRRCSTPSPPPSRERASIF